MTEHDKDESTGFFDLLSWENEHLLLWTIPETGGASEYISAMFEEIYERFSGRTRGVLLVDVRRGEVPGAASRANIVAGVNRLSDNLSAVAIVVGSSITQQLIVQVSRFMMTGTAVPFRMFTSIEDASAWLMKQRERD